MPSEERDAAFYGTESYEKTEDGYCLKVRVPGAGSSRVSGSEGVGAGAEPASEETPANVELTVQLHGLDLDIRAGNVLRRIPLPNALRGAAIRETEVREGILYVYFSEQVSGRA